MENQLKIRYDPEEGYSCSDALIDKYVDDLINASVLLLQLEKELVVGSELIILAIRAAICEGRIPHDKVIFMYRDENKDNAMYPNSDGRCDWWPTGFCDHFDKYLETLLSKIWKPKKEEKDVSN